NDEGVARDTFRTAVDHVPAAIWRLPVDDVVSRPAEDLVVASTAVDDVVAREAVDCVVTCKTQDGVAGRSPVESIRVRRAADRVLAIEEEVVPTDRIGANTGDPVEGDRAATVDRHESIGAVGRDVDPLVKVGIGNAEAAQVDLVLPAIRVGVEAGHDVISEVQRVVNDGVEPGSDIDGVIAGTTANDVITIAAVEGVVAVPAVEVIVTDIAVQRIVTCATAEIVVAIIGVDGVIAVLAVEAVIAGAAADDVVELVARTGEVTRTGVSQALDIGVEGVAVDAGFDRVGTAAVELNNGVAVVIHDVGVAAISADQKVRTGAAVEDVSAIVAEQHVIPGIAHQGRGLSAAEVSEYRAHPGLRPQRRDTPFVGGNGRAEGKVATEDFISFVIGQTKLVAHEVAAIEGDGFDLGSSSVEMPRDTDFVAVDVDRQITVIGAAEVQGRQALPIGSNGDPVVPAR